MYLKNADIWRIMIKVSRGIRIAIDMKRIFTILLTAALALTLCACDRGKNAATASDLTQAEIQKILAEMEAQEAAQQ